MAITMIILANSATQFVQHAVQELKMIVCLVILENSCIINNVLIFVLLDFMQQICFAIFVIVLVTTVMDQMTINVLHVPTADS